MTSALLSLRRRSGLVLSSLLVVFMFSALLPTSAVAKQATPAATPSFGTGLQGAVDWLLSQEAADGGFVGFSGTSDPGATTDAVIALGAAKINGIDVDLSKAVDYLEQNGLVYAQAGTGQAAKLALAMFAAGESPLDVGGVDPIALVVRGQRDDTKLYGTGVYDHALSIMALTAAGETVPQSAYDALKKTQIKDGSWAFDGQKVAGAGDTNPTAVVVQTLVVAGKAQDPMIGKALEYLKTAQAERGGFAYQPAAQLVPDANSTALVVQALIAAGQDPASAEWKNAAGALAAFQNPSGAFYYQEQQPDDNLFATLQAIPAIAGQALPVIAESSENATPEATPAVFAPQLIAA
jgi:prenyltransferase beta subunit